MIHTTDCHTTPQVCHTIATLPVGGNRLH